MRNPTLEEKVQKYEEFLHKMNLAQVCMSAKMLNKLIQNADSWSYAHRVGNGEFSDEEQQELINKSFNRLTDID